MAALHYSENADKMQGVDGTGNPKFSIIVPKAATVSRKGVNKIDQSTKGVNKIDLSTNIMQAVDNARITAAMCSVNMTTGQSESDGQTYARSREWHLKEKKASSIPQDTSRTWHMVLIFCPTFVALVCSLSLSLSFLSMIVLLLTRF